MFYNNIPNPCPYYAGMPALTLPNMYNASIINPYQYCANTPMYYAAFPQQFPCQPDPESYEAGDADPVIFKDYGPEPFTINIEKATEQNNAFRRALWTGAHLQLTLMSIRVGEDIGLEVHPNTDQFIRIEDGQGLVKMGDRKENLNFRRNVYEDYIIIIPAGKWHNIINTGRKPLKLYSIYAPPQHPHGTVHETKAEAQAAE